MKKSDLFLKQFIYSILLALQEIAKKLKPVIIYIQPFIWGYLYIKALHEEYIEKPSVKKRVALKRYKKSLRKMAGSAIGSTGMLFIASPIIFTSSANLGLAAGTLFITLAMISLFFKDVLESKSLFSKYSALTVNPQQI